MAHQWRGVVREYADRLPVDESTRIITLGEGGTPLVYAPALSELVGGEVYLKVEGMNPTGSFKDRGMTMAITAAVSDGAKAVVCASTGNTSASAAAYATQAGLTCAVLVPAGKIAMGKLSQAVAHGAEIIQIDGNFDGCLDVARKLAENYPVFLVNSVNPSRIEGQKTAAFEVVDFLGDAPDYHLLPVGNAGNITAYWKGYQEYSSVWKRPDDWPQRAPEDPGTLQDSSGQVRTEGTGETFEPVSTGTPIMWGFQAEGASPIVQGHPITEPETVATAIRIGNPASWEQAEEARDTSGGVIESVTDEEILHAHRWLSSKEGVFVEPASASGVAGLIKKHSAGQVPEGKRFVITVTGHGLKDPEWAINNPEIKGEDDSEASAAAVTKVDQDVETVARQLGL